MVEIIVQFFSGKLIENLNKMSKNKLPEKTNESSYGKDIKRIFDSDKPNFNIVEFAKKVVGPTTGYLSSRKRKKSLLQFLESCLPNFSVTNYQIKDLIVYISFIVLGDENKWKSVSTKALTYLNNCFECSLTKDFNVSYIHDNKYMNECFFNVISCENKNLIRNCLLLRICKVWCGQKPSNLDITKFTTIYINNYFSLKKKNKLSSNHCKLPPVYNLLNFLLKSFEKINNEDLEKFWIHFLEYFLDDFIEKNEIFRAESIFFLEVFLDIIKLLLGNSKYTVVCLGNQNSKYQNNLKGKITNFLKILFEEGKKSSKNKKVYEVLKNFLLNAYNGSEGFLLWPVYEDKENNSQFFEDISKLVKEF